MLNRSVVNIIGCGYSGIEAALFLAGHGIKVHVFGHEKIYKDQTQDEQKEEKNLYESLLERELSLLGSPLIRKKETLLQEGASNCIDQLLLSYGMNMIKNHENIEFFDASLSTLSPNEITIIASGHNTEKALFDNLIAKFGSLKCLQGLPIFPVLQGVHMTTLTPKAKGQYFLSLDEEEYFCFASKVRLLALREKAENEGFEILPNTIEDLALHNKENLRIYSMLPQITEEGRRVYATVEVRQKGENFVLPNISSGLSKETQLEIFSSLKGFEKIKLITPAGVTKGKFVNPIHVVNEFCQSRQEENIFFAGGIMGIGGGLNSIASGLYTAMNVYKYIQGRQMIAISDDAALGKLIKKLTQEKSSKPRPLIINEGITQEEEEKTEEYCQNCYEKSLKALEKFKEEYKNGKYV